MSHPDPRPIGSLPPPTASIDERDPGQLLRQRAEAIARTQGGRSREEIANLSVDETRRIIHELYVHHIELEMQNEELHRVQSELDAARARYFDLYDLAPLGYCTVDERGLIVEANLAAATLLGIARAELIHRPIARSILWHDEDIFYLLRKQLSRTGEAQSRELRMVRSDGTQVWVQLVAALGRTAEGASELRCMLTDISSRKEAEELLRLNDENLRVARRRAESASQAKLGFLAMSDEIRAPVEVIGGLSRRVRSAGATPEQKGWLDELDRAGEHLFVILNQLLDLSKIEAGQMQLDSLDFQISTLLDGVASAIGGAARDKGLRIEKIDRGVPRRLRGDPSRLLQALLIYARNAVRFTREGSIVLRARLLVDDGDDLLVRFSVEDTGVGIGPDQMGGLFGVSESPLPSTDAATTHMGLGHAIAWQLAQLMGGKVGAESTPGVGSTFWLIARLERGVDDTGIVSPGH